MSHKIRFRKRAAKEYLEAIAWYKERSLQAAENFILIVQKTLDEIEKEPEKFRKSYKHFHEAKTKRYPYKIIYFINNEHEVIIVTTLFHQKRNPKNKFKR